MATKDALHTVRTENIFVDYGNEEQKNSDELVISQEDLNEIRLDHATMSINEEVIGKLESFGFPTQTTRQQIHTNVLNHATASYFLLI